MGLLMEYDVYGMSSSLCDLSWVAEEELWSAPIFTSHGPSELSSTKFLLWEIKINCKFSEKLGYWLYFNYSEDQAHNKQTSMEDLFFTNTEKAGNFWQQTQHSESSCSFRNCCCRDPSSIRVELTAWPRYNYFGEQSACCCSSEAEVLQNHVRIHVRMSSDKRRKARIQGGWAAAPSKARSDGDKPQMAVTPAWCGKNVDVCNPKGKTHGHASDELAKPFVYQKPDEVTCLVI